MNKISFSARVTGAVASLFLFLLLATTVVRAETVACPAGYVCTPVTSTPVQTTPNNFCYIWSKNIRVGDNDADVSALRTALIKEGVVESSVLTQGAFNEILASGVVGFQEKYSSEILTPNNLRHGTGYVGPSTRAKLNALYGCSNVPQTPYTNPVPSVTPVYPQNNLPSILTGPVVNPSNGHSYYLLSAMDWNSSEAFATRLGGHLVTINDSAENAWVVSQFSNYGGNPRHLWIGLNDAVNEGAWIWASNDASNYRNWTLGEPNDGAGIYSAEDAVHIWSPSWGYASGTWNDAQANLLYEGVVEVGPTETTVSCPSRYIWNGSDCVPPVQPITQKHPPVIDRIKSPTTLEVNQLGTWSIRAHDQDNESLSYSIDWGDSYYCPPGYTCTTQSPTARSFVQNSSFTHSYSASGTYTVWIEVRDSSGLSTQSTVTVQVTEADKPRVDPEPPQSSPSVLSGPIVNSANGHKYYLLSAADWDTAEAKAVSLGGHLVTIDDAAENAWVTTFSRYNGIPQHIWIGLNDASSEGNFVWSSGSQSSYRNWAVDEPNNGAGVYDNESAVHLWNPDTTYGTGTWNDGQSSLRYQSLVEVQ